MKKKKNRIENVRISGVKARIINLSYIMSINSVNMRSIKANCINLSDAFVGSVAVVFLKRMMQSNTVRHNATRREMKHDMTYDMA